MLGLDRAVTRRLVPTVLAFLVAGAFSGPASAQSPEQELAQRYAPVVRLVAQPEPCKHGEPFEPIDADLVLGNPEVALHGPWSESAVLKVGPTGKDLSAGLFGYHLDFPGDALHPGCDYENWERHLIPGTKPRTYARVVTEPRHPHQLALQYWFFYVYNDWNDKHEGDWEMIQLDFPVGTAAEALVQPAARGRVQPARGRRARRVGLGQAPDRRRNPPVVYPAMGSHANYYSANLWLGRSAAQGVGCDDTVGPSRQLRPEVVLFPTGEGRLPGRVPVARLRRRLGRGAPAVLRRPDRPEHEVAVDGADHVGERVVAGLGVRDPGRQLGGHLDDGLLLRRGRGGLDRPDEARRQPDGRAHHARRAARHPDLALLAHPLGRDRPVPRARAGARGARSSPRRSTCTAAGRACSWGSASSSCRSPC